MLEARLDAGQHRRMLVELITGEHGEWLPPINVAVVARSSKVLVRKRLLASRDA